MKKFSMKAILCAAVALLCLGGCGQKKTVGMVNPVKGVPEDEVTLTFDIELSPPEGATDVNYFTITGPDRIVEQVTFTYEGRKFTYRAAPTDQVKAEDLSGIYNTTSETQTAQVGHCEATVILGNTGSTVYWLDVVPGISYALSTTDPIDADTLTTLAQQIFQPMQGEA